MEITKDYAYQVLNEYIKGEYLLKHSKAVSACMEHFASLLGEDVEKWGIIGLLHDIDYELYPNEHCKKAREILEKHDFPEEYIHAVQSHGYDIVIDIKPEHIMEKVLYTIDELTGIIFAAILMRPSKSILDLETKSVKKKYKSPSFAAGCNREVIEKGLNMLSWDLDYVITQTIEGMKKKAVELDLVGNLK
ncbi:MAG: HDIG domain-containing protein [Clostridiaceae bacterium]|nr:HDIG domain-containing protein [Clostridiaceae bacterium]